MTGIIFKLHNSNSKYHIGFSLEDSHPVPETEALEFLKMLNEIVGPARIDHFVDPETGDEMWEAD